MNNIKSLRNFGTIYLWIFAFKVLQICGDVKYRTDTDTDRDAVIADFPLKPYAYQIFDDVYTDDLLNERNAIATPLWQTLNKQQQQLNYNNKRLWPLLAAKTKAKNGNSLTSREITFENLNNFDNYKIKTTIWPKVNKRLQQQHHVKANGNDDNDIKAQRQSLEQYFLVPTTFGDDKGRRREGDKQRTSLLNIRSKENSLIPVIMEKHFKTQTTRHTKKSETPFTDANTTANKAVNERDDIKENLFPLKDDNTLNVNDINDGDGDSGSGTGTGRLYENESAFADKENGVANSNGNGNESFNYADNNEANSNYMMTFTNDNDHNRDSHLNMEHQIRRFIAKPFNKRAKPTIGQTPFLPAVSGGAMTNLGKFFRDLSKNVHVSEQFQWNADEQKLLEGDPNFGNIHHHLTKPDAATDQQTAEWIKAIRFYRPSQKIRSLVAMNPHGQWAHSSQFIDPNYMWVGLGK